MKQIGFRNLGFCVGGTFWAEAVIDLPIFGFDGNNPYPVRANTMKQIGFHNSGLALGGMFWAEGPCHSLNGQCSGNRNSPACGGVWGLSGTVRLEIVLSIWKVGGPLSIWKPPGCGRQPLQPSRACQGLAGARQRPPTHSRRGVVGGYRV